VRSASQKKNAQRVPWILGAIVLTLLTVAVLLQSSNYWKVFPIETASDTLLLYFLSSLNFIAFIVFGFILLRSIIKLVRERRTLQLGAKIKTRLLMYFFAVSLMPIFAMAVFSYLFMNRALERWFTNIPENVIREARELQARSINERSAKLQETVRMLATMIDKGDVSASDLDAIATAGNLTRIEVLSPRNVPIAQSSRPLDEKQQAELNETLELARAGKTDSPILRDAQGFDAVVAQLSDGRRLLIVPNYQAEESVSHIADNSLLEFERLGAKQANVRQIGLLTLGVLTFLLIFASAWTAFYIARGLTVPIRALAEGADEIAHGNFSHRVDVFAEDELALLVGTFNMMSAKLEENAAELESRRHYIETVLHSLPNGVISFDNERRISTINPAAKNILKITDPNVAGRPLSELLRPDNSLTIDRLLSRAKRVGHASEQTALRGRLQDDLGAELEMPVALIATALPATDGVVLVIEDLSELIAAQRAAAWQEVARRMAHEIKNPLTPIQLSAERIAKKFGAESAVVPATAVMGNNYGRNAELVKEGTDTILREVRSLKSMVDEFSRFARLPDAKLEPGDVSAVIAQVLSAYKDRFDDVSLKAQLAKDLPPAMIDEEQLKRVFINLIENSIEAFAETPAGKEITISSRHDAARDLIIAEVTDNGPGIDPGSFQKLFQPYFSTKGRGTGLGLAIVNRIVSDHQGKIRASAGALGGAKFVIELPVMA
jgi:nitrogen fixation/metabolism regulation signal transduction histidine kinase